MAPARTIIVAAAARTYYYADDTGAGERAPLGQATACALVANLINPVPAAAGRLAVAGGLLAASVAVALVIGAVEATVARLRLRAVPQYILIAVVASLVAVLATRWRGLA